MMSGGHRILLILVGVSLLTSGQAECPPGGWEESRSSCYLLVLQNRSQADAQSECITKGGNLTSVVDEEENNFISNMSMRRCGDADCPSVWFGLMKMGNLTSQPKEKGWSWFDGSTYDNGNYNKWEEGEPSGGVACARMYVKDANRDAGKWGDFACDTPFPYVCKRRATAPSATTTKTTTTTSTTTTTTTTTTPPPVTSSTTTRTGMNDEQDWVSWRGNFYLFLVEKNFTQDEAVTICMSYGGHLASVRSPEENEFIYNRTKYSCTDSCTDVWIGLRRHGPFLGENNRDLDLTERRANWTWLDGQTYSSSWANWKSTEPNGDSVCARMTLSQVDQHLENWADIGCDRQYPCVCKKEAVETTAVVMPTTEKNGTMVATSEQSGTPGPTKSSTLFYFGAGVGVGVLVSIIVAIILVVIVVKKRKKSERCDVTNSQSTPSGGDGDAGGEGGYSYVKVRPAKIMNKMMAGEGIYSEANIDAESQDVDTASEASVTLTPPTLGRPSMTSPSHGDEHANVKSSTLKRLENNSIQKNVTQTAPTLSDAPEYSKSGDYDNDPVSPTTHKVADSGDEYALVLRSDTGEMTMAPPGGQ